MRQLPPDLHDSSYSLDDIPDSRSTSGLAAEMDLTPGDCYEWGGHLRQILSIDNRFPPSTRESLTVTNPAVSHPQDSEAGEWNQAIGRLYAGWRQGSVQPKTPAVISSRDAFVGPV